MARMYPPVLDVDPGYRRDNGAFISDAEREVFEELKSGLNDDWDVFHSVWFRDSAGGEHAEGDFILIGPQSVLLLEVKGGSVERKSNGEWHFKNNKGRLVKMTNRGPVDQARGAWYALKNHVEENSGRDLIDDIVWGYGVITPDCEFRVQGADPGFSKTLWLGENGFPDHLTTYLADLSRYWRLDQEAKGRKGKRPASKIKPTHRELLIRNIRPILGYVEGLGIEARRAKRQRVRLTRNQYRALDYSRLETRIVLQGGAGTGKTLLAMKKATMEARNKRVLFTCYNRLLADRLERQVETDPALSNITVLNYHQLVMQVLKQSGISVSVPEDWKTFNEAAPELVLDALAGREGGFSQWDYLVIDEGQDLLSKQFFSVLDMLIKGGMEEGSWLLCIDTEQAIFSDQYDASYADELIDSNAFRVSLSENCRNTHQISAYGHAIGDVPQVANTLIAGPIPNIQYYSDMSAFKRIIKKQVNRLITDFRMAGINERYITILLAQRGQYEEAIREVCSDTLCGCEWLSTDGNCDDNHVQISTIQAFKGLESDAVVLAGFNSLDAEYMRRNFYVGATRARAVLEVLLPEDSAGVIEDNIGEVLKIIHDSEEFVEVNELF